MRKLRITLAVLLIVLGAFLLLVPDKLNEYVVRVSGVILVIGASGVFEDEIKESD